MSDRESFVSLCSEQYFYKSSFNLKLIKWQGTSHDENIDKEDLLGTQRLSQ